MECEIIVKTTLENESFFKIKLNAHVLYDPLILLEYLLKRNKCLCPPQSMNKDVHGSFIQNSPKLEETQTAMKVRTAYLSSGILLSKMSK